ncbi:hypothetical protein BD310DRAFT_937152 [Dichomitus squalens]|uniref:Uncharacterized protein n=1 Tax=Dichomitus squalens TaxID=114155 RepID=A0A4Q9PIL3_9APHY|nr:hypothetical protein BD310DRAFT_937152 [Dichomitus squalens]
MRRTYHVQFHARLLRNSRGRNKIQHTIARLFSGLKGEHEEGRQEGAGCEQFSQKGCRQDALVRSKVMLSRHRNG